MKSPLGLEARLPVIDIIKESAVKMWQQRQQVLQLFLPVILVMTMIDFLNITYFTPDEPVAGELPPVESMAANLLGLLFTLLMATTAHKFTLLDAAYWPRTALHLPGRHEVRYFVRFLQLVVIAVAVVVIASLPSYAIGPPVGDVVQMFGIFFAIYVLARLSVTLPEIALGHRTSLGRAWDMSKNNGGALVLLVVILPVVLTLPVTIMAVFSQDMLVRLIGIAGTYFATLLALIVMSTSYQFLLNFYEPDSPVLKGRNAPANRQDDDDEPPRGLNDEVQEPESGDDDSEPTPPDNRPENSGQNGRSGSFDA